MPSPSRLPEATVVAAWSMTVYAPPGMSDPSCHSPCRSTNQNERRAEPDPRTWEVEKLVFVISASPPEATLTSRVVEPDMVPL